MTDAKAPEEKEILDQIEQFRRLVRQHEDWPQDIEDRILHRFLHSCYYDLEKSKDALELFFGIRTTIPDMLVNRDPMPPQIQNYLKIVNIARLQISGNRNLWLWQLNDPGLEKYDYKTDAKVFFMCADLWMLFDDFLEHSDVCLMDVKDLNLKFLSKFNLSIARKMSKFQQEAMPLRLQQVHLVNCPSFIDKIYSMMKPMLKQEMAKLIHFHPPNSDTLHQHLSKEDLPVDFGGTNGKMEDHMKNTLQQIAWQIKQGKLTDNLWTLRKKLKEVDEPMDSFRSLAID